MVPNGTYEDDGWISCRGINEVERTKLTKIKLVSIIGNLPWGL